MRVIQPKLQPYLEMEFHSPIPFISDVPDSLTIPQFMFECLDHPDRPKRDVNVPWFIENDSGRRVFGDEVRQRTYALARGIKETYRFGEDDVALVFSRNHVDYAIVMWAVHTLGGIVSGTNPDFSPSELVYQITEAKASILFVYPDCLDIVLKAAQMVNISADRIILFDVLHRDPKPEGAAKLTTISGLVRLGMENWVKPFVERRLSPGEARTKLAFLSFSSGTTGRPKAVATPHYSIIANVLQLSVHNRANDKEYWERKGQEARFRPGDVVIGVLPVYHIYALMMNLHFCLFAAMTYVAIPKFNHIVMLESIMRYRISHLILVPPQIVLLCKHPATPKYNLREHVRFIVSAAAPLTAVVNQQLYSIFPEAHIGQLYGMTELSMATMMFSTATNRGVPGSSGVLVPGVVLKIEKADGTLAGYDEPGEMILKTPSVSKGYANNEKATKETFVDGWVRTGDEVMIRRDGEVFVIDRLKEIMKVKGFQVAPAELEGFLFGHPDVENACVVGVPDSYKGEVPMAFVVLRPNAADRVARNPGVLEDIKKSIMKYVEDNKVEYKHLAGGVEVVEVIPTSASGKMLRRLVRKKARELWTKRDVGAKL